MKNEEQIVMEGSCGLASLLIVGLLIGVIFALIML